MGNSMNAPRIGITSKLTLALILFSLLLLGSMVGLIIIRGREETFTAIFRELDSVAAEKLAGFNDWKAENTQLIGTLAGMPHVQEAAAALIAAEPGSPEARRAHAELIGELTPWVEADNIFFELLVIEPEQGRVIAATAAAEEGKFKENLPYFIEGRTRAFVQSPYYSLSLHAPAMTASVPILDSNGKLIAVLAGRMNLTQLSSILTGNKSQYETRDVFFVNASRLFVTQPRFVPDPAVLLRTVDTEPVNSCLANGSGQTAALDYRGLPVLAVYRWLPEDQLCLVVKLDQAEVLQPLNQFVASMLIFGLGTLILASALGYGLARQITRPILVLQEEVARFGRGELELELPETARDELGLLAREFNQMAAALAENELRLERQVAERTAALQKAQQVAHLGSWVWHIPENRLEWSDEMYCIFGIDQETFSGHLPDVIARAIHPQDRAAVERSNLSVIQEKQPTPLEYRVVWPDGTVRTVWAEAGELTLDNTGQPLILTGIVQDITERKQAQAALAASHKRFESLIEHAPDGIALLGLDGVLRQVTPSTQQILGYTLEESIGQNPASMTHPDDLPALLLLLNDLVQDPSGIGKMQYRFRHRDGSWRWLDSTISNLVSEPSVQAIVFNYRDITGQKQAEEALRRSEERYRGIFDAAPVSIWLEDWTDVITAVRLLRSQGITDFRRYYADHPEFVQGALQQVSILDVNDETLATFKAKAKEEMLASLGAVFATDDTLPGFVGELVALGEGERIYRTEMALRTVQGDLIHVLLTMTFPSEDSASGDVLVSLMDITERRQAEVEIRRLNNELEERVAQRTLQLESANKELQSFAYSVSHDLRAPLRSIDGFSQALLRKFSGQLGTEGDHYLSRVRENTQRMGQLIDDMLTLSRVSRQEMSRQPVDLMALAREIAKSLTESDAARQVTFKIPERGIVQGDPGLLRVMMQNLFENAWKFTARREHAEIEVGLSDNGARVFHVRDNGAGFDMQYAGKLFGAFQRLHSPKEYPGTGIGLATVQRVIHRHGGRVWAEAAVDQGATFYFTLGEQS